MKRLTIFFVTLGIATATLGDPVDTDGNALTNTTAMGDIDMARTSIGDFFTLLVPDYQVISSLAMNALTRTEVWNGYTEWVAKFYDGDNYSDQYNGQYVGVTKQTTTVGSTKWCPTLNGEVCGDGIGDPESIFLSWDNTTANITNGIIVAVRKRITPTKLSELTNDTEFVTKHVTNGLTTVEEVTSTAFKGYGWPFTQWTYTPPQLSLSLPVYTNNLWRYTETNALGQIVGTARWVESPYGDEAVELTDTLNGTNVVFTRAGTAIYTNVHGLATLSNLNQYVKHTELEQTLETYVTDEELDSYDSSYKMVEGLSTQNQSISFIMNTDSSPAPLQVVLPQNGRCKDWIIYVNSVADMQLVLPPAIFWIKDSSVTNAIAGGTPTALYFSQVSQEGVYTIGRQEYGELVEIQGAREMTKIEIMKNILSTRKKVKTSFVK